MFCPQKKEGYTRDPQARTKNYKPLVIIPGHVWKPSEASERPKNVTFGFCLRVRKRHFWFLQETRSDVLILSRVLEGLLKIRDTTHGLSDPQKAFNQGGGGKRSKKR